MPNSYNSPGDHSVASPKPNDAAIALLQHLMSCGFWGNITLKLQHGDVIHIVREESIPGDKIAQHVPNKGENHVSSSR